MAIIAVWGLIMATYRYAGGDIESLLAATLAGLCAWRLWTTRNGNAPR